jgi:hypothetical protein
MRSWEMMIHRVVVMAIAKTQRLDRVGERGQTRRGTFTRKRIRSMATKTIIKPAGSPAAVGPYNHAVRVGGLLFCAGQIPIDPATGNLISGDIRAQTERVLQNVKAILDDQRLTFANVVKTTVFYEP